MVPVSPRVAVLRVAPVKGLACVLRDRVQLERDGVPDDRRLFLLRADGTVVTLRRYPQLNQVVPDLDLAGGVLSVALPDGTRVTSALERGGAHVRSTLFGKGRRGTVVPGAVGEALSDVAAEPLRLVLADRAGIGWDEGPVSLLGGASAESVEAPGGPGEPAGARFRMLVELEGTQPFEEDSWVGARLGLGGARLRVTHRLQRCVVINYSPSTGARDWDGLRALAAHRGEGGMSLGVIADVDEPGEVAVGDAVEVLGR